jgi:hypothetical protein
MKFIVEYEDLMEQRKLTYIRSEWSFDMEPIVKDIDFELILNKVSLSVLNDKVIQLWGFCGLDGSMKSSYQVPEHKEGSLKVQHVLKHGFAYGINDEDLPVFVNTDNGWICIGNPEKTGKTVEFIRNCVANIDDNGSLISLWLKPEVLPMI